jgi:hypothetical protein
VIAPYSWIGAPEGRPDAPILVAIHVAAPLVSGLLGHGLTRLEAFLAGRVYAAGVER